MVSKPMLDEIGRRATEIIKLRTRLGYGVPESSGDERPEKKLFEKLAPSTIKNRKKALGEGVLGSKVKVQKQTARFAKQGIKPTKKVAVKAKPTDKPKATKPKQTKKLASGTSPGKSNLTFTGEMVEAIQYKTTEKGVVISLDGTRNKQIGTYHMTGTNKMPQRRFLDLAKGDVNQIRVFMKQFLKAVFDRLF